MKKWLWTIPAILLLLQLIPVNRDNPAFNPVDDYLQQTAAPEATAALIRRACYDCHSNQTVYPWYSRIAPLSFWLKNHVDEGREHLNFSLWGQYPAEKQRHKLEESAEVIGKGEMPMKSYTWAHPEARLTDAQRRALVAWFSGD
jgi:mono/diheme cytochrome c family protein